MNEIAPFSSRLYGIYMARRRTDSPDRENDSPEPSPETVETTVFRSGNSDAVRLPRRFALEGKRVRLRRLSGGRLLIEPVHKRRWPPGFFESFGRSDSDLEAPTRPPASSEAERRAAGLFGGPVE